MLKIRLSTMKHLDTVLETWVLTNVSKSTQMPWSSIDDNGMTDSLATPSAAQCLHRLNKHHMVSGLAVLSLGSV